MEPIDFEQLARDLVDAYDPEAMADRSIALDIAEALRQVWNDRGAADIDTFLAVPQDDGSGTVGPIITAAWVSRTIQALDR